MQQRRPRVLFRCEGSYSFGVNGFWDHIHPRGTTDLSAEYHVLCGVSTSVQSNCK
jgi:hypothetical protein